MNEQLLKELGLDKAANRLKTGKDLKRKLAVAYEHYRFVSPDRFDAFQKQMHDKTKKVLVVCRECKGKGKRQDQNRLIKSDKHTHECTWCRGTGAEQYTYDKLAFVPLKDYPDAPPPDCLLDLKKAKERNCFDSFEVAKVETVEVRPDPIIFGLINNCVDKFFITQWDDDVKIEDILKDNEG